MVGKFTVILLLLVFSFLLLTVPVSAQTPISTPSATIPLGAAASSAYTLPPVIPPTSPYFTDLLLNNMFHTFSCLAVGSSVIGQPCLTYQIAQNAQGVIQSVPVLSQVNLSGGALGTATSLLTALYMNPPIRTIDYLASVGQGLGIVKEAQAQGVVGSGANVLNPVLSLWQVSRNISYVLMIIIFVIIGLMVMFRQRINPQTVITAQSALPGLVIGLIMITFSYFFAALLTDTAFIGTNLVGAYFSAAQPPPKNNPKEEEKPLLDALKNQNVINIMSAFIGTIHQGDIHNAVSNAINQLGGGPEKLIRAFAFFMTYQYSSLFVEVPAQIGGLAYCVIAAVSASQPVAAAAGTTSIAWATVPTCQYHAALLAKAVVASGAAIAAAAAPATAISWALFVILFAILIYTMFKLLLRLINNFLAIIFYTVTAPFHFLAASLPGRQGIATGWILNMLCNILAFPAVIAVFYFINFLLGKETGWFLVGKSPFPATGESLDLISSGSLPLFGGLKSSLIRLMLAYGALMATPAIPDIICRAIGRVGQAGQLLGQEAGGGYRAGQQYIGKFGQAAQEAGTGIGGKMGYDTAGNPIRITPGLGGILGRAGDRPLPRAK